MGTEESQEREQVPVLTSLPPIREVDIGHGRGQGWGSWRTLADPPGTTVLSNFPTLFLPLLLSILSLARTGSYSSLKAGIAKSPQKRVPESDGGGASGRVP